MTPQELLRQCADSLDMKYPALNCITLVHPRGTGRFPFRGKGVELLQEEQRRTVYSVDIEVVLKHVAHHIADARRRARDEWEAEKAKEGASNA